MGVSFALVFLLVAVAASLVLGAGSAWLVVRKTKRPVLWVLAPVFALLWLMLGSVPLGLWGFSVVAVRGPVPRSAPGPVQVAPAEEGPAEEISAEAPAGGAAAP